MNSTEIKGSLVTQEKTLRLKVRLSMLYVLAFLGCVFLSVPLSIGGLNVPNFYSLVLILITIVFYIEKYEQIDFNFLFFIFLFFAINIGYTFNTGLWSEKLKGLFQTLLSIALFITTINFVTKRDDVNVNFFGYLILFIIFLSFLEIFTPFREISDAFRRFAFSEGILYANIKRDVLLSGHIRPNLFSSEPSHVTKLYFVISVCYCLLLKRFFYLKTLIIVIVGFYLFGSPIIILSFVLIVSLKALETLREKKIGTFYVLVTLPILVMLGFLILNTFFHGLSSRVENIAVGGGDGSFQQRIIFPFFTLYETISNGHYFGIGLSAKEYIANYSTLVKFGISILSSLGNNALAHMSIYFGIPGVILFLLILRKFLKKKGQSYFISTLTVFFIFANTMGGFETPRFWLFLALMIGVVIKKDLAQKSE